MDKKFRRTTPSLVFIVFALMLILINWLVWKSAVHRMTPKDEGTEAALALLATRNPFTARTLLGLCWLVPVWPAILGIACWYFGIQKQKTLRRSRTCPKCNRETLREIPLHELIKDTKRLTESERKETELKTAYIRIYRCSACSEEVKIRIPLEKDGYECCPSCGHMTLHKEEKYRTIIKATTSSEGLMEARHRCMYCDAEYMVGYTIPKINPLFQTFRRLRRWRRRQFRRRIIRRRRFIQPFLIQYININKNMQIMKTIFIMGILSFFLRHQCRTASILG